LLQKYYFKRYNKMKQIDIKQYEAFGSPLSPVGVVNLRYSGPVYNPGFKPSTEYVDEYGQNQQFSPTIDAYDIGGTLASPKNRDVVIRKLLGLDVDADVKKCFFKDLDMTTKISKAQRQGIESGQIVVTPYEEVKYELNKVSPFRTNLAITVGTNEMATSFLEGAGLVNGSSGINYIDGLITTEEAFHYGIGQPDRKTPGLLIAVGAALAEKYGVPLSTFSDDTIEDALAAAEARDELVRRFGKEADMQVFLIKRDATEDQLGMTDEGIVVASDLSKRGNLVEKISKMRLHR
jgi:hypothetical protein